MSKTIERATVASLAVRYELLSADGCASPVIHRAGPWLSVCLCVCWERSAAFHRLAGATHTVHCYNENGESERANTLDWLSLSLSLARTV